MLKRYNVRLPHQTKGQITKETKRFNKIFEINKKFRTPNQEFIKILRKTNIKLTRGSDSHSIKKLIKFN